MSTPEALKLVVDPKHCPYDYHVIWNGISDWRVVQSDIRLPVGYRLASNLSGQRYLTQKGAERACLRLRGDVRFAWEEALSLQEQPE